MTIFDRLFAEHDLVHWRKTLDDAGLIFGVVGRVEDIRHDEQVLAAGFLRPYADEPDLWTIDSPFFLAGQEKMTAAHRTRGRPEQRRGTAPIWLWRRRDRRVARRRSGGMSSDGPPAVQYRTPTGRLVALLDHLGVRRVHIASQIIGDMAGLAAERPERVGGVVCVTPVRLDPVPFERIADRVLTIAGEYGPTAETVRRAVPRLPGAKRVMLEGYEAQGWSDTAADCTGELVSAMTGFLSRAPPMPRRPPAVAATPGSPTVSRAAARRWCCCRSFWRRRNGTRRCRSWPSTSP